MICSTVYVIGDVDPSNRLGFEGRPQVRKVKTWARSYEDVVMHLGRSRNPGMLERLQC
jgi:hypothetical protein